MIIVCSTSVTKRGKHKDFYQVVETQAEAETIYTALLARDDLYCAAICTPTDATEPHWMEDMEGGGK